MTLPSRQKRNRKKLELATRRGEIQRLMLTQPQLTGEQIGELLGIHKSTVSREYASILAEWRERCMADTSEIVARELAKLELIEKTAWEDYHHSRLDRERRESELSGDAKDSGKKVKLVREGRIADTKFLAIVLDCMERRAKLLGLDAPDRSEVAAIVATGQQVRIVEDDDWYGNASRLLPDHSTPEADAASTEHPPQCIEVQSCSVRSEVGQNSDGPASDDPGPRQPPGPVPGSD